MKKGKLLNIALSIAFINILFVCFSIINVNAEEDTDTLNTNDESTVMESGWTNKENQWYYYDHGEKKTGWFKINGEDYYAASSGVISAQWVGSGNTWYYVDAEGKMVTGDYVIDERVNHFDANGVWNN